jgi:hypothetical protein
VVVVVVEAVAYCEIKLGMLGVVVVLVVVEVVEVELDPVVDPVEVDPVVAPLAPKLMEMDWVFDGMLVVTPLTVTELLEPVEDDLVVDAEDAPPLMLMVLPEEDP